MPKRIINPKRCILYYPTITVPNSTWLRQSLLYWDEIGSIVPQGYDNEALIAYTPDIRFLIEQEQFRPFRPDNLVMRDMMDLQKFEEEFRSILESSTFQTLLPPTAQKTFAHAHEVRHRNLSANANQPRRDYLRSRIHQDKLSSNLFYYLEEHGLARRSPDDYQWFQFEERTALLYMAILAKYLADEDMQATVPGTDDERYERFIFRPLSRDDSVSCFSTRLDNILPIPRADVSLSDIVRFKQQRRGELLRFRQMIDEFQTNLRKCKDGKDVREAMTSSSESVEIGVNQLQSVLDDARLATVAGSFKTIIKLDSPALWATAGVITNQAAKVADLPIGWSLAGVGILGAIQVFAYWVDRRNEQRAALRNSPFAYLYHARRRGVLPERGG